MRRIKYVDENLCILSLKSQLLQTIQLFNTEHTRIFHCVSACSYSPGMV